MSTTGNDDGIVTPVSEQGDEQITPSEQGSGEGGEAATPQPTLEELRKQLRDEVRAELSSEIGKKLSEQQRRYQQQLQRAVVQAEERAAQAYGDLYKPYVPEGDEAHRVMQQAQAVQQTRVAQITRQVQEESQVREYVETTLTEAGIAQDDPDLKYRWTDQQDFDHNVALIKKRIALEKAAGAQETAAKAKKTEEQKARALAGAGVGAPPTSTGSGKALSAESILEQIHQAATRGDYAAVRRLRDQHAKTLGIG